MILLFPLHDAHVKAYWREQDDEAERRAEYDREKTLD